MLGAVLVVGLMAAGPPPNDEPRLPARVRRIVLHVLGGPVYADPERRWLFETPERTLARWAPRFGAHWILWTDGTIWPRKPSADAPGYVPPLAEAGEGPWLGRIAREAAPVFSHLHLGNSDSVGIELAHSGRMGDRFEEAQVRSLAWLLRNLLALSGGRLTPASIVGHKDCDQRPAYTRASCERPGCPVFVDTTGWPYRRRVDPPEALFGALAAQGLVVPRPDGALDGDLRRAEAVPAGTRPNALP